MWDISLLTYEILKIYWNISLLHVQAQKHKFRCFYTMSLHKNHFKKQKYGTACLRNIENFKISMKCFTVAGPDSGTQVWVFLYNVSTQEPFWETKICDRVCLRNIQNFKILMKYFTVARPDSGTRVWMFLYNANTQTLF